MDLFFRNRNILASAVIGMALAISGCQNGESESVTSNEEAVDSTEAQTVAVDDDGWWCPEHGVPEGICARCSTTLAAEFQEKGDWCEEHARPDSQCFICHPELQEEFAAQYVAKFGVQPPEPEEEDEEGEGG